MITSICKKGTQALNYLAHKKGGRVNKMKAIKLVYFADRYHLRKYGRPVVGDMYWAMKYGPVGTTTLRIANLEEEHLDADCFSYARTFLVHPKGDIKKENLITKGDVDIDVFSQTDIEALEAAYKEFGDKDQFELAEITHEYPEWSKHRAFISSGNKRVLMDYKDFFLNPKSKKSDFFEMDEEHLKLTKSMFSEKEETESFLS